MYDPKNLRTRQFVTPKGHKHFAIFLDVSKDITVKDHAGKDKIEKRVTSHLIAGPFQRSQWATNRLRSLGGQTDAERAVEGKAKAEALKAAKLANQPANVVKLPKKTLAQRVKGAVKRVVEAVTGPSEATA